VIAATSPEKKFFWGVLLANIEDFQ